MAAIQTNNGDFLKFDFISDTCFRLRMSKSDDFTEKNPYARYGIFDFSNRGTEAVYDLSDKSKSVIITPEMKILISDEGDGFTLSKPDGTIILKSDRPFHVGKSGGFSADLAVTKEEKFYGMGDVNREILQKRGTTAQIWVKNVKSYVPIPFLMSSAGWAVFSNTTFRHNFDICDSDPDIVRIFGYYGELDILFFMGEDYKSLLNQYTAVSGRPVLLPKFGYGLTFVSNMQANAREMLDDCMRFRDRDIPCDVIGLEPGWMETYYDKSVDKKFDSERFYIPEWFTNNEASLQNTFFGAVNRLGFKLSLWLCCDYDLSYEEERNAAIPFLDEVIDEDMDYLPSKDDFEKDQNIGHEPLLMDKFTKKDEGYFEHLKKFVDLSACAFKMDGAWQVNEHPDRKWGNKMDDEQMHNLYPLLLSKQMSTGFSEHTGRRSMIYSSGGFAGIQQYAATWAGDTGGGSKPLISMLNHAMSGHVNTSCDMHVFTKEGIHFGFLQSWSQVCSWAYWRHPWLLGKELEEIFRYYAKLRYSLIPYIYSTAYQAYLSGMPIMRPLPFLYPDDPKSDEYIMEYMFGDSLLITCYTEDLYLPEGKWIDWFTGDVFTGPYTGDYSPPKNRGGAIFVKAGAIIPTQEALDYIGQKPIDSLTLEIFPEGDSSCIIYDDDGISMDYQSGTRSEMIVTCSKTEKQIQLVTSERQGTYKDIVEGITLLVKIHTAKPVSATLDMGSCKYTYIDGCLIAEISGVDKEHNL
ncbi:MAG: DUF5110 domain-containing protein, partial [Clostridiales bacterium]|nr:DUF5110 domain-containing protein [Clostridiales bacterium]